jgi:hypothetical protein
MDFLKRMFKPRPPWWTKVSDIKKRIRIYIEINKLINEIFFFGDATRGQKFPT